MKNVILLVTFIFTLSQYSKGQDCDCERTTTYSTKTVVVCEFNSGTIMRPGIGGPPYSDVLLGPCVFVIVDYAVVTCNGFSSLFIKDAVYVDNRDYWINIDAWLGGGPYSNLNSCTPASIREEIMKAIGQVIASTSLSGSPINTVYFENSCSALAKIQWPDGAFFDQPGGDGEPPRRIELTNSFSYSLIPCNATGCCKVSYQYVPIVLENGLTEDRYVISSYSFEGSCGGSPDMGSWQPPTASGVDPNTGQPITVQGGIAEIGPCLPMCNTNDVPPTPFVNTDITEVTKETVKFELIAAPTQFNNYIKFISTEQIQKIGIYDARGRKISASSYLFKDNELTTFELKSGIYYIQAYFPGNTVRTIKVIKD